MHLSVCFSNLSSVLFDEKPSKYYVWMICWKLDLIVFGLVYIIVSHQEKLSLCETVSVSYMYEI